MNYSNLSDFEVNKLVAIKLGYRIKEDFQWEKDQCWVKVDKENEQIKIFDYCGDANDALPIILDNEISIIRDVSTNDSWEAIAKGWVTMNGFESSIDNKLCHIDKNPLRAAMIVFLMTDD